MEERILRMKSLLDERQWRPEIPNGFITTERHPVIKFSESA
jgi:hypothetical protein